MILGPFNLDRERAATSFRRLVALDVDLALPGHGEPITGTALATRELGRSRVRVDGVDYTRLGATGLQVSRICLGMMSYGSRRGGTGRSTSTPPRPLVRSAVDAGVIFFDTADMYADGASEEVTGTLLREFFAGREDYVLATKVFYPMGPGPTTAGCRASTCWPASTPRCAGWAPTTSTSTRSTGGTRRRRSRRRWRRCTTSCAPGKARYIGASSMWAWQFAKAQQVADSTVGRGSSPCRTTTT